MFGASGVAADAEVIGLMLEGLKVANMHAPVLLLGHMGIYLGLVEQLLAEGRLDEARQGELFGCIQRKGASDIRALLDDSPTAAMLIALPDLMGDSSVLELAGKVLNSASESVRAALDELKDLAAMINARYPQVDLRIDVSELSGYGYHNGPVFAVYHPQHGSALAQGGRYDGVGDIFGRGRAATGFDLNLKQLMDSSLQGQGAYFAPYTANASHQELAGLVSRLRDEGHRVIVAVAQNEQPPHDCIGVLVHGQNGWQVQSNSTAPNEQ
jgi:ATP phosphoribosyltransferase regulatory subunit